MKGIGGNLTAYIQSKTVIVNEYGEHVETWVDVQTVKGWLDMMGGDSRYSGYHAKIQESTHVFVCDYVLLNDLISAENSRMIINGKRYDITMIDNPMEMQSGSQLEFYLKYTGGQ